MDLKTEQSKESRAYPLWGPRWGLGGYFLVVFPMFILLAILFGLGRCLYHDVPLGETFVIVLFSITVVALGMVPAGLPVLVAIAMKVRGGRHYYASMIRVLAFVLPINLMLAFMLIYAIAFTPPDLVAYPLLGPASPLQLLWINVVITLFLACPLLYEPEQQLGLCRSETPQAPILPPLVIQRTVVTAVIITFIAGGLANWDFHHLLSLGVDRLTAAQHAQTVALTTVVFSQVFYVLNCRSLTETVFRTGLFSNRFLIMGIGAALAFQGLLIYAPPMQRLFGATPLEISDLICPAAAAFLIFPVVTIEKWIRARLVLAEVSEHDDRLGDRSSLSHDFSALLEKANGNPMTIGAILDMLAIRGHALLLVFFSFPLCLPVGIPILTTLLGPLLAFISFFLIFGRRPWLPKRLRNRSIPYESLERLVNRLMPLAMKVEKHLHYRLLFLTEEGPVIRLHAVYMCLLSLVVSIPLPILFLNLVAALPILLLSLGMLKRDGFFVILAYVAVIPCFIMYGGLVVAGVESVQHMMRVLGPGG